MFIKKSFENEIVENYKQNISDIENINIKLESTRKSGVIELLSAANEILKDIGLVKDAACLSYVINKVSRIKTADAHDPSIPKSSEEALKNLEEKGWMFNADDEDIVVEE